MIASFCPLYATAHNKSDNRRSKSSEIVDLIELKCLTSHALTSLILLITVVESE